MSAITRIINERRAFYKRWRDYPDICIITKDMYDDLLSMPACPLYVDNVMGMKIDIGNEFKVKFETDVIYER